MKATAFVYSERFGAFSYGHGHPMRPARLRLTRELMEHAGVLHAGDIVEARPATDAEILSFHTEDYLTALEHANSGGAPPDGAGFGLGAGDNPVFRGVFEWSALSAGASIQAAELVATGVVPVAFNIAGGLHHAMAGRASGFCYINDAVLAIKRLIALGKRVAYVDIDAHHGDGVERAFYSTDRVLTISIHESGDYLFPGTGFTGDMGEGAGEGFAVNLPLAPYTNDAGFVSAFEAVVPEFVEAFAPDVLVTQLGVDTMESDPITHLALTTNGFEAMLRAFKGMNLPWVALGGGGYDMSNVARCWTLAWGVMSGRTLPDVLGEEFYSEILGHGIRRLRDEPIHGTSLSAPPDDVMRDVERLKTECLPRIRRGA